MHDDIDDFLASLHPLPPRTDLHPPILTAAQWDAIKALGYNCSDAHLEMLAAAFGVELRGHDPFEVRARALAGVAAVLRRATPGAG